MFAGQKDGEIRRVGSKGSGRTAETDKQIEIQDQHTHTHVLKLTHTVDLRGGG